MNSNEQHFQESLHTRVTAAEKRIRRLEERQDVIGDIQKKVMFLDGQLSLISKSVDKVVLKMENFRDKIQKDFVVFTNKIRDINSSFIRWLIGTVAVSLVVGLICLYGTFNKIHESIFSLDKKITEINIRSAIMKSKVEEKENP